jgi:DNA-binding GntR family transcriptional regulator
MRAAEHAYATVRDGILTGKYHAGSRLTEQDLARAVKVSRTPVREALRRLHAEGLVQFEPNHGAIVSSFGIEAAEEIFELRALLEPLSARLAAERATDDAIAAMRALAEQQVAESTQRKGDFISRIGQLNDLFHRAVQAAAQNMRLGKALAGLIEAPLILRTFRQYSRAELVRSADQHLELVQAFQERDPERAHSIMRAHILAGRSTYLRGRQSAIPLAP